MALRMRASCLAHWRGVRITDRILQPNWLIMPTAGPRMKRRRRRNPIRQKRIGRRTEHGGTKFDVGVTQVCVPQ